MRFQVTAVALLAVTLVSPQSVRAQNLCTGAYASEMVRFECLLTSYREASTKSERDAVAAAINNRYGKRRAVFVLDLTGFTSATSGFGELETLSAMYALWRIVKPAVESEGGLILKDEGDTFFATFPLVTDALDAALKAQELINQENQRAITQDGVDALRFCSSIGIGFGQIYQIGDEDAFGEEVNYAYDAGENRADANQILMTQGAKNSFVPGLETDEIELKFSNKVSQPRRYEVRAGKNDLVRPGYALWEVRPRVESTCFPR